MFENEKQAIVDLEKRIKTLSAAEKDDKSTESGKKSRLDLGVRIISDLIAGVFVGFCMGIFLDNVFDTKPILMIIFLLLGGAAGFLNVYRTLQKEAERLEQEEKKEDK